MSIALTTAFSGSAGAGEAGGAPHRPFSPQGVARQGLRLVNEALWPLGPPTQAPFGVVDFSYSSSSLALLALLLLALSTLISPAECSLSFFFAISLR